MGYTCAKNQPLSEIQIDLQILFWFTKFVSTWCGYHYDYLLPVSQKLILKGKNHIIPNTTHPTF